LDSASTIHVCNDRSRFTKYRDLPANESLLAGHGKVSFNVFNRTMKKDIKFGTRQAVPLSFALKGTDMQSV
jgi:hypothetical protein